MPNKPVTRSTVRSTALVFLIVALVFSLAALAWAATYPVEQVRINASDAVETVPGTEGAAFSAFARWVVVSTVAGVAITLWVFVTQKRGLWMMLWTAAAVGCGTWWFVFFGSQLVDLFHADLPDKLTPGSTIELVEYVAPSVGVLAAPSLSLMAYWLGLIVSDESGDSAARETR